MKEQPYKKYKVLKEFDCKAGKVAPWFGQEGNGTQFFTDYKITNKKSCKSWFKKFEKEWLYKRIKVGGLQYESKTSMEIT